MSKNWVYSKNVKEHFFNPVNIQIEDPKKGEYDTTAKIGSPLCGDVMQIWLKIDHEKQTILKMTWRTFGCASAIASTSILSQMVEGMSLSEAVKMTPKDIITALGGLPSNKIHCSVLGDQALRKAITNYFARTDNESSKKLV
jgi:nitrogen fixation NifU-like protein